MKPTEINPPKEQKLWRGSYRDIGYKVSLHAIGEDYTPAHEGIWCYYIYLHEKNVKDFAALWLEGKVVKITEKSYGYVSCDYYQEPFNSMDFHGGITFYDKHGHTEGYRYVEIGCDYNHLWDQERGGGYNLDYILWDVKKTIDGIYEMGILKEAAE